jgi:hypothetical protein
VEERDVVRRVDEVRACVRQGGRLGMFAGAALPMIGRSGQAGGSWTLCCRPWVPLTNSPHSRLCLRALWRLAFAPGASMLNMCRETQRRNAYSVFFFFLKWCTKPPLQIKFTKTPCLRDKKKPTIFFYDFGIKQ